MSGTNTEDDVLSPIYSAVTASTPATTRSTSSANTEPPSASSDGSFNPPSASLSIDSLTSPPASSMSGSISIPSSSTFSVTPGKSSRSSSRSARRRKEGGRAQTASSVASQGTLSPTNSILSSSVGPLSPSLEVSSSIHDVLRYSALYAFPALLAITLAFLQRLATVNITPLYNSTPLQLHSIPLYAVFGALPATSALFIVLFFRVPLREIVNPRACLVLMALNADIDLVLGRRTGSMAGALFGPQWGALFARWASGALGVWAGAAFTLLCIGHVTPPTLGSRHADLVVKALITVAGCAVFTSHMYYAEQIFQKIVVKHGSFIFNHPEKFILFICLFLTALSLFVRSPRTGTSFAAGTLHTLSSIFKLDRSQSEALSRVTGHLPRSVAPLLFLLRVPLLVLAIRQQVFLRPSPPYVAANGTIRVLHSSPSLSGQIVVADNLAAGYRFLRCDGSLLGGRWMRQRQNGSAVEFGDSIFAAFVLQEVGTLASRSDETESLARTISLTTDLEIQAEELNSDAQLPHRALTIGLGVGISAMALSRRGYALDVVEIDPAVYQAAVDHFDFRLSGKEMDTINIMPGHEYIAKASQWDADLREQGEGGIQRWSYVIHDCFSAGSLPVELYTKEFWERLAGLVEDDGIVAVNIAGVMGSVSVRRIIVTLLFVFEQCRGFGEMGNEQESKGLMNMDEAHYRLFSAQYDFVRAELTADGTVPTPILPTPIVTTSKEISSPWKFPDSRSHMYSNFLRREISLDDIILPSDLESEEMILTANGSMFGMDQIPTALETWRAMQTKMWLVW